MHTFCDGICVFIIAISRVSLKLQIGKRMHAAENKFLLQKAGQPDKESVRMKKMRWRFIK